jgi:hypothetical protein
MRNHRSTFARSNQGGWEQPLTVPALTFLYVVLNSSAHRCADEAEVEVFGVNRGKEQRSLAERRRRMVPSSKGNCNPAEPPGWLTCLLAKTCIPHWKTTNCVACLAVASLLALGGCAPLQVKLGMKVYLDRTAISSIQARLPKGPGIAPGEKSPLVVTVTEPDGKVLMTEGQGQGKVMWRDLAVKARVVTTNEKGVVSLPWDPRVSDGKVPHVTITVPSHPGLQADMDIPLRYNYNYSANFSGSSGSSGFNGSDGMSGTSGSMGSMDPNNPSPGGNGSDGTDGSNGQDGGRGGDAPPVQIRVALRSGSGPLLQVSVSAVGEQRFYLVDPHGGSLTVIADGGPGGSGGRGGRGGRGGSGGIGTPNGSSGRDGSDGRNGWDGSAGKGGNITVTYDPQARPFLTAIHLSNKGGPPPLFKEEPLGPLW